MVKFYASMDGSKNARYSGVEEACENIYSTFLEPSAGDGEFSEALF